MHDPRLSTRFFAGVIAFICVTSITAQTQAIRIMPLGDSITYGSSTPGGYRLPLYVSLTNAGYNVDYVGTRIDNAANALGLEVNHQGLGGWKISDGAIGLYESVYGWFEQIDDPHVVLLHIGTNDSGGGNLFTNAVERLDALITRIALCQPSAHIIVTTLIPRAEPTETTISNVFNRFVPDKVASQQALGRNVHALDMHAYLTTNDMYDTVHPTASGYAKMADAWYTAITNIIGTNTVANQPAAIRATGSNDCQTVSITFNKRVSFASATNLANYALSGGLTLTRASLSASQRSVTLTTSLQSRNTSYTVTVNNVEDETAPAPLAVPPDTQLTFAASALRGYLNNVPEASDYTLVYSLDLPSSSDYRNNLVPYAVDNSALVGPFARVAYYLELQRSGEPLQYVWVSMDAFTNRADKLGLPTLLSGVVLQRAVANMNVFCNVPGVTTGTGIATGNIEFWPYDYSAGNAKGLAGASDSAYDFGDACSFANNYSCMQVHNHGARQTLFALNHWHANATLELGIGNQPSGWSLHPDWTFSGNAGSYTVKSLCVLVLADAAADAAAPQALSAQAGRGRNLVTVTFSEALASASVDAGAFALDNGVTALSASLQQDQKTVNLLTSLQPEGTTLTLSVSAIRDLAGNRVAPTTLTVTATPLPIEIVSNVGALASGYQLVYSLDIPVKGNFISTPDVYRYSQPNFASPFDRVAYYLELQKADGTAQYVWTSMDAFTADAKKIGVPTAASGAVWQQAVTNLDVKSNVSGVSNGVAMAGGAIEFWPTDYGQSNALSVANASDAYYDWGDVRRTTGAHGSMQLHNAAFSQVLFAMNNWGADSQSLAVGIGNRAHNDKDWTGAGNAGTYAYRKLHVLVRPTAAASLPAPAQVLANVPESSDYQLAYTVNLPVNGSFFTAAPTYYSVNNVTNGLATVFSRVAYYLELQSGSGPTQWVWTAMDAFTADARKLGVPTNTCFFQTKVTRLDVRSNAGGIVTGSNLDTGNIEFWPSNYGGGNALPIPNAHTTNFDFGDGSANGTSNGHGSMQVHNYGLGAAQTLFAINNFNNNAKLGLGIGSNTDFSKSGTPYPDWTFSSNADTYNHRRLHVFVLPGAGAAFDAARPALVNVSAAGTLDQIAVVFSEALSDASASAANFTLNNGATVTVATLLPNKKQILLATTPLTAGLSYTLTVVGGVKDRSPNGNAVVPFTTFTFAAPAAALPAILSGVPEAADYELLHQLSLANTISYANGATYSVDKSLFPRAQPFDRIAYCLELTGTNGIAKWVYASMDAFTPDITRIGLPTDDRGAVYQQYVSNLNIYASANVENLSVTTGVGIAAGNIEFWASNYGGGNAKNIPGASASTYDFGDDRGSNVGAGHGTMQVHNYAAGHTVFAINSFGSNGRTPCLGIGNNPVWSNNDPDWTHTYSGPAYSAKNLYVLIRNGVPTATSAGTVTLLSHPRSQTLYLREQAHLYVNASGATGYQWRKDGVAIAGATRPWLDFDAVALSDAGSYDVVVTGVSGFGPSLSATLTVIPHTRPQAPKPLRIMPLGDSITYGSGTAGGYRLPLYSALTAAGYNVDFVGTRTDNGAAGLPDSNHQGLSGWRIQDANAGLFENINDWLFDMNDPDVVLLHIGTNDSGGGTAFTNAVDRLDNLMTRIATNRPSANIIVTTLMKRGEPNYTAITNYFNPYVEGKVLAQQAQGRKAHFLDMHAHLELSDLYDNLHPNAGGYQKMANAWFSKITNVVNSTYGDGSAPALCRAVNLPSLQGVQAVFSKPMDPETALSLANYALSDGVTISGAALSADNRTVTLTTSPLTRDASYTLTVNGLKDFAWPTQQDVAPDSSDTFRATVRGYLANVPEAANYRLAYSLNVPMNPAYSGNPVTYSANNTLQLCQPLKRVAYYMELQPLNGDLTYLWVSMDPFTGDIGKIGVPTKVLGTVFQQSVNNMNVVCNDPSVTSGTGLAGNIEFWPSNYASINSAGVPGASDTLCDFGDRPDPGSYGSMQVHSTVAGQTLFAFNNWGSSGGSMPDIGIGNCPTPKNGGLDWTFLNNGWSYPLRSICVLVELDADTTRPTLVSAQAGQLGTLVTVTFSEALAAGTVDGTRFTLDNAVAVISATLLPDLRTVTLATTPQPAGETLTLTVTGVRDLGGGHAIIPNSTISVQPATLPPEVLANVGALADGFQVVYTLDIPATGNFIGTPAFYRYNQSQATGAFDRVAYHMELLKADGTTQYVWTAMDAFTQDRTKIGVPTAASGAVWQQAVANLDVKSNVSGVTSGTGMTGGTLEFWPTDYAQSNEMAVANASHAFFDWGDLRRTTGGHGSMQVHNAELSQVLFAMNNWGTDNQALGLGIGNRPGQNDRDWTHAGNAATYGRRTLHVMIRPTAPTIVQDSDVVAPTLTGATASYALDHVTLSFSEPLSDRAATDGAFAINTGVAVTGAKLLRNKTSIILTTSALTGGQTYQVTVSGVRDRSSSGNPIAPSSTAVFTAPTSLPALFASVPESAEYSVIHQLAMTDTVNYNPSGAPYSVDESRYAQPGPFDRIAYCLELTGTNGVSQWVYVSMDAFTTDLAKIGVPTLDRGASFQQYVSNLNIFASANIAGVTVSTGASIPVGNIEFWPSNYSNPNALGIPGASEATYDFGDTMSAGNYGSMQVHNTAALQTIFALNHFGGNGFVPCLGIGNQPAGNPDWTFNENARAYTVKNLYVLARWGGNDPTGNGPEIIVQPSPIAARSRQKIALYVQALGATAYQWRRNGLWIPGATQTWLEFSPVELTDADTYDVLVYGASGVTASQSATLTVEPSGMIMKLR
jgi:lysophospholipase L1-like esterase